MRAQQVGDVSAGQKHPASVLRVVERCQFTLDAERYLSFDTPPFLLRYKLDGLDLLRSEDRPPKVRSFFAYGRGQPREHPRIALLALDRAESQDEVEQTLHGQDCDGQISAATYPVEAADAALQRSFVGSRGGLAVFSFRGALLGAAVFDVFARGVGFARGGCAFWHVVRALNSGAQWLCGVSQEQNRRVSHARFELPVDYAKHGRCGELLVHHHACVPAEDAHVRGHLRKHAQTADTFLSLQLG